MKKGVLSIDVESNGLYGFAFVIGAVVINYDNPWEIVDSYASKYKIIGKIDPFVEKNVISACKSIPLADLNKSYSRWLLDFAIFYKKYKDDYDIVCHIPYPVETNLFKNMIDRGVINELEAPYPIYCPSSLLLKEGYDPLSVDQYYSEVLDKNTDDNIIVHNPYWDAIVAGRVFIDLLTKE